MHLLTGSIPEHSPRLLKRRWLFIWSVCQFPCGVRSWLHNINHHLSTWYCPYTPCCRPWKNRSSPIQGHTSFPAYHTWERWNSRDLQRTSCLFAGNGSTSGPIFWWFWYHKRDHVQKIRARCPIVEALGCGSGSYDICWIVVLSIRYRSKADDDAVGLRTANVP